MPPSRKAVLPFLDVGAFKSSNPEYVGMSASQHSVYVNSCLERQIIEEARKLSLDSNIPKNVILLIETLWSIKQKELWKEDPSISNANFHAKMMKWYTKDSISNMSDEEKMALKDRIRCKVRLKQ
jgi:hypothetical protein